MINVPSGSAGAAQLAVLDVLEVSVICHTPARAPIGADPPPPPLVKVPVKLVVPAQEGDGPAQVQLLDPLKVLPDTVAVSEVMVVVPPSSG